MRALPEPLRRPRTVPRFVPWGVCRRRGESIGRGSEGCKSVITELYNLNPLQFTSHVGPFSGLFYYSDLSLRSIGGMLSSNYIAYFDGTQVNMTVCFQSNFSMFTVVYCVQNYTFLRNVAYPFLDAVADFYLSYVTKDSNGVSHVLNACAQVGCCEGVRVSMMHVANQNT